MTDSLIEDREFEKIDFTEGESVELFASEYDSCIFTACDFSGSDLSNIVFINCQFENCNFSNATVKNTSLNDVRFQSCKLLGVAFSQCNPFVVSLYFQECDLNMASFYDLRLKGTEFKECRLHDVDFIQTDLTRAVFDNCDLHGATFGRTTLVSADFRTSINYSINPEENRIKNAKFSIFGLAGLLEKYNIRVE